MRTNGSSAQFPWQPQSSREIQPWTQGHLFYHWLLVCKMLKLSADREVAAAGLEWCFLCLFDLGFLNFSWTAEWFQPGWLFGAVLWHIPASITVYQTCYIKYQNGYGKVWLSVDAGCLCSLLPTLGPGPIFSIGNSQKIPPLDRFEKRPETICCYFLYWTLQETAGIVVG